MIQLSRLSHLTTQVADGITTILLQTDLSITAADHQEKTGAYDLLTIKDVELEKLIRRRLATITPDVPIVGEELGGDPTVDEYWLVDPIDGTIHFIREIPFSMAMVTLIQQKRPVVSVLVNLLSKDVFYAYKDGGAYKNGQKISVSSRPLESSVVLIESNLSKPVNALRLGKIASHFKTMNLCCAGYEFCLVASGQLEARAVFDGYGQAYDFAAGSLLVTEAGGVARNLAGEAFSVDDREFIVASSEVLYNQLKQDLTGQEYHETAL